MPALSTVRRRVGRRRYSASSIPSSPGASQERLGRDAQQPLNGERRAWERRRLASRLPCSRHRRRAREPERHAVRACQPGTELDGGPVVLRPAEGDDDGASGSCVSGNEERDVAGRLVEERRQLLVGSPLGEEPVGRVRKQQLDVELTGEPRQLLPRHDRRERSRPCRDASRVEL